MTDHFSRQRGQVLMAWLLLSVLLVSILFGGGWLEAKGGALGDFWQTFSAGFQRFSSVVALP